MSDFEIRDEPARRTAVVHGFIPMSEIPQFMGRAFPAAWRAITAAGLAPGGPPFSRYFSFPSENMELEAGITIADSPGVLRRAFEATDDVQPGELPAGQVAVGWHVGPYDTIHETYAKLMAWIAEEGREPGGPMWEVYWSDPAEEPDPSKWRTEILVPLA
jgi:effector-binding domain-containing protein